MQASWRSVDAYDYLVNLDSAGIAWEFLRRNPEYQKDYQSVSKGYLLAQRWGAAADPNLRADKAPDVWLFPATVT